MGKSEVAVFEIPHGFCSSPHKFLSGKHHYESRTNELWENIATVSFRDLRDLLERPCRGRNGT